MLVEITLSGAALYVGGALPGTLVGILVVESCRLARAHFAAANRHAARARAIVGAR